MANIAHPDLLADILSYCERENLSKAAFGKRAFKDPRFVFDLEAGRQCLPRTVAKARAALACSERIAS